MWTWAFHVFVGQTHDSASLTPDGIPCSEHIHKFRVVAVRCVGSALAHQPHRARPKTSHNFVAQDDGSNQRATFRVLKISVSFVSYLLRSSHIAADIHDWRRILVVVAESPDTGCTKGAEHVFVNSITIVSDQMKRSRRQRARSLQLSKRVRVLHDRPCVFISIFEA